MICGDFWSEREKGACQRTRRHDSANDIDPPLLEIFIFQRPRDALEARLLDSRLGEFSISRGASHCSKWYFFFPSENQTLSAVQNLGCYLYVRVFHHIITLSIGQTTRPRHTRKDASPYQHRPTDRTNPCRGNSLSLSRLVQLPLWGREKKKQQQVSNPLLARLNEQIGGLFFFFDQQDLKGGGAGSVLGQDPAKHPWRRPPRR